MKSSTPLPFIYMPALILMAQWTHAIETTFSGDPLATSQFPRISWNTPSGWSHGVPDVEDDVIIPTHRNGAGQIISGYGPTTDSPVTINDLTMEEFTNIDLGFRSNFFVSGTTSMLGASLVNSESECRLGTLTQYDPNTNTLNYGPNFVVNVQFGLPAGAILEFNNADVVTNNATLQFLGQNIRFRDQLTGLNALQNFADNQGDLFFDDGFTLNTASNFSNSGRIYLNYRRSLSGPNVPGNGLAPEMHIAGNFVNNGSVEIYAKSVFTVSGNLTGSGNIKIFGFPFVCDVGGIWNQTGGSVNLGDGLLDSFWLKAVALDANGGALVKGSGTIKAHTTITSGTLAPGASPGTVNIEGNLVLTAGSTLAVEIAGTVHDKVIQKLGVLPTTGTTLGGLLTLSTIDDFDDEVLHTSTYEILTASAPLTGSFSNIASGGRLNTTSGKGSFRVHYGPGSATPGKVILSDYIAVNTPQTYAQWIVEQAVAAPDNDPLDDPNQDGISNLEAYSRGMSAGGSGRRVGIKVIANPNGFIEATLSVPRTVTGINLNARTMSGFSFNNSPTIVSLPLNGTTPTRNLYTVFLPLASPRQFVRFGIELDP